MCCRFNYVLLATGITYPPREAPGETKASGRKQNRASSPGRAISAPSPLRTYDANPQTMLMHYVFGEPFSPTHPVMVRAHKRARSRGADAAKAPIVASEQGKILCFCNGFCFLW